MKSKTFNEIVQEQLKECENILIGKGFEYAPDATDETTVDRLAHFKKAAAITGSGQKGALFGMLAKHLVSLSDMCTDGNDYSIERWAEKITDSINYLLILRAVVEEEGGVQRG